MPSLGFLTGTCRRQSSGSPSLFLSVLLLSLPSFRRCVSIQWLRPNAGVTLDYPPSLTAHMHVIGKSNGTNSPESNRLFSPPLSLPSHCLSSTPPSEWVSFCHPFAQNPLLPSCPIQGCQLWSYCPSASNPAFHTCFYVAEGGPLEPTFLLGQLAACGAGPVGGARGRPHPGEGRRDLLPPVLFSVGFPSAPISCEWYPSPAASHWQRPLLPVAVVKSTLQLVSHSTVSISLCLLRDIRASCHFPRLQGCGLQPHGTLFWASKF